jgi:N-acetylmuramoyl-L-alanine amidase
MSDLKPGDLVFFDTNGGHNNITHVGIYIGDSKFVHAESGSVRSVRISSLYESYYARNYMTARRIVN